MKNMFLCWQFTLTIIQLQICLSVPHRLINDDGWKLTAWQHIYCIFTLFITKFCIFIFQKRFINKLYIQQQNWLFTVQNYKALFLHVHLFWIFYITPLLWVMATGDAGRCIAAQEITTPLQRGHEAKSSLVLCCAQLETKGDNHSILHRWTTHQKPAGYLIW